MYSASSVHPGCTASSTAARFHALRRQASPAIARPAIPRVAAALLSLAVASALPASARDLSPAVRTFVEELALARARTDAWEQVARLPLGGERRLGDWAAESIARERALRGWVRQRPRSGAARLYSDGTCDVDVWIEPDELTGQLRAILAEESAEPNADRAATWQEFERAARRWPVIWAHGTAAADEHDASRRYPGWEDVSIEGVELARRAAAADAVHALLEEAGRLKLTAARRLADFLRSDEAVRAEVLAALEKSARVQVTCGLDQVASAQASLPMTDLIRILTDVHQRVYRGDEFHAADFREMALMTNRRELRAAGLAVPPQGCITRPAYELVELDRPAWADQTLGETGQWAPLDGEELPLEVAAEVARYDAMDRLRRRVEALVVLDGVTVSRLLESRAELKDDVVIFLTGARRIGRPEVSPQGTVAIRVELPLLRLWWIVRRAIPVVEVDPPEAASAPAP